MCNSAAIHFNVTLVSARTRRAMRTFRASPLEWCAKDMIDRAGIFDAQRAEHAPTLPNSQVGVNSMERPEWRLVKAQDFFGEAFASHGWPAGGALRALGFFGLACLVGSDIVRTPLGSHRHLSGLRWACLEGFPGAPFLLIRKTRAPSLPSKMLLPPNRIFHRIPVNRSYEQLLTFSASRLGGLQ